MHLRLFLTIIITLCSLTVSTFAADPPDWQSAQELHPGIKLLHESVTRPRRMHIYSVRIDVKTPGLKFSTTPRAKDWTLDKTETIRQTTRDFIRASQATNHKVVFAANADAFSPWPVPWNEQTPTNLLGLAVADGIVVSPPSGTPSLIIKESGEASIQITQPDSPTENIHTAISGFALCLIDGVPQEPEKVDLHPRMGVGLSGDARYVVFVAIDGRRFSRQGATTAELGEWLKRFGADDGINLDGGGSTTFAWWNPKVEGDDKCELINTPVGNSIRYETEEADRTYKPSERNNGNNVGIYYLAQ